MASKMQKEAEEKRRERQDMMSKAKEGIKEAKGVLERGEPRDVPLGTGGAERTSQRIQERQKRNQEVYEELFGKPQKKKK